MQISVRANGVIQQFGDSLGPLDGCTIHEVDGGLWATLQGPGVAVLNPDGTITVTPPAVDHVAHAALMEQRANDAHDHALILGKAKTDPVFAALARQLGIPMEG